ncbi:MAG: hypothetical protein ACRD6I_00950 [Candidatus Acidiferrales bacterium]
MALAKGRLRVFTVVEVWRGMAAGAKHFWGMADAARYQQRLREKHNLMEDDVQLFIGTLHLPKLRRRLVK